MAQQPFDCHHDIYRVIEQQGGSQLQKIVPTQDARSFAFEDLHYFSTRRINATGFRQADGFIYGLLLGSSYTLCRITGDYQLEELKEITSLPSNLLFVAADISPDQRFLVIFGYSTDEPGNMLALVDLTNDQYETQIFPLIQTGPTSDVKCADIAFHPTTHLLYGYDHYNQNIITIDINLRQISAPTAIGDHAIRGNVPSIFFDENGVLYGIGSETELLTNRSLLQFDIENNNVHIIRSLPFEGNQDACSCPPRFQLWNRFHNKNWSPCSQQIITVSVFNYTDTILVRNLLDSFPSFIVIDSIHTDLSHDSINGLGTHWIRIKNLVIPSGVDSLQLFVSVGEIIEPGAYENTVYLTQGADQFLQGQTITSDDPESLPIGDPTSYFVSRLSFQFDRDTLFLCNGLGEMLKAEIAGSQYLWSNGDTASSIFVTDPGTYWLEISTNCESFRDSIYIDTSGTDLTLPDTIHGQLGEIIEMHPDVHSSSEIIGYFWYDPDEVLSCVSCQEPSLMLTGNGSLSLQVISSHGCESEDSTTLILRNIEVFAPNAFTPDDNGINDRFNLWGNDVYEIEHLQIFDRWGNRVYQSRQLTTNNDSIGWDGMVKRQKAPPGVYLWKATIVNRGFQRQEFAGSLHLIR